MKGRSVSSGRDGGGSTCGQHRRGVSKCFAPFCLFLKAGDHKLYPFEVSTASRVIARIACLSQGISGGIGICDSCSHGRGGWSWWKSSAILTGQHNANERYRRHYDLECCRPEATSLRRANWFVCGFRFPRGFWFPSWFRFPCGLWFSSRRFWLPSRFWFPRRFRFPRWFWFPGGFRFACGFRFPGWLRFTCRFWFSSGFRFTCWFRFTGWFRFTCGFRFRFRFRNRVRAWARTGTAEPEAAQDPEPVPVEECCGTGTWAIGRDRKRGLKRRRHEDETGKEAGL